MKCVFCCNPGRANTNEKDHLAASEIKNYGKTKAVYAQFHKLNWPPKFCNERRREIETHKIAQIVYVHVNGMMLTQKELTAQYDSLEDRQI